MAFGCALALMAGVAVVGSEGLPEQMQPPAAPANLRVLTPSSPASLAASAGTPQSTPTNSAFPTALRVTVRDTNSNLLSGVTVTFTAPASGATARFSGSATATAVTDASGVATAPTLTANATAGSYTVIGTVSGVSGSAAFSLTNTSTAPSGGSGW